MFNIAFPEFLVIAVVAIIVIGPDKLPGIVRGAGLLLGRMQRYVNDIKADINNELKTEDLKRLHDELLQHDQGLNEALRQGMQPVETVLQQSTLAREQAQAEKTPSGSPSSSTALPEMAVSTSGNRSTVD
ncbi:MAG: Sec-independent protein translocase protein TatB [Methylophaga sp.]